jgi:Diacylglycerol kinase accessory domain.
MCDGMLEVVGFTSMLHMGQVQTGLTQGIKICQGRYKYYNTKLII